MNLSKLKNGTMAVLYVASNIFAIVTSVMALTEMFGGSSSDDSDDD